MDPNTNTEKKGIPAPESAEPGNAKVPIVNGLLQEERRKFFTSMHGHGKNILTQKETPLNEKEIMRYKELEAKIRESDQKWNILNSALSPDEMKEFQDLNRRKLKNMVPVQLALLRMSVAIDTHFEPDMADKMKLLTNHVIGYYLNSDRYHTAVHALGMTLETMHLAYRLNIKDQNMLRALLVACLYHDTGNGKAPIAPDSEIGDEVQAVKIFLRDLNNAEDHSELSALKGLKETMVNVPLGEGTMVQGENNVDVDLRELIAGCINNTVFRDRFEDVETIAKKEYSKLIAEELSAKKLDYAKDGPVPMEIQRLAALSMTIPAKLVNDGDLRASTSDQTVLIAAKIAYEDRQREQMPKGPPAFRPGDKEGPVKHHKGFGDFISGLHSKTNNEIRRQAQDGSPLQMIKLPAEYGGGEAAQKICKNATLRAVDEQHYFDQIMESHGDMAIALYLLIEKMHRQGKNPLTVPLHELAEHLRSIEKIEPEQINALLEKDEKPAKALNLSVDSYPLLTQEPYRNMSISELTDGMFHRIFFPGSAIIQTEKDGKRIEEMKRMLYAGSSVSNALDQMYPKPPLTPEQKKEIERIQKQKDPDPIETWNRLRGPTVGLRPAQIIELADAGVIHSNIAESREEAKKIQDRLEMLLRINIGEPANAVLDSLVSVNNLVPRAFRAYTVDENNTQIIKKGTRPGKAFVLLEGDAYVRLEDGTERRILNGEIVGERHIIRKEDTNADVFAQKGARFAVIPAAEIEAFSSEGLRAWLLEQDEVRTNGNH